MSTENVSDIREILQSIDALKEQAEQLHGMHESQDNTPKQNSLRAPHVAEMVQRNADVVLLDDVYRKGTYQQERNADLSSIAASQKAETRPAPGLRSIPSDAEFDQMLSTLMKDMEHESKSTGTSHEPKLTATGQASEGNPNEGTNLEADIEGLLSPYLNTPEAPFNPRPAPAPKTPYIQKVEKQGDPQRRTEHKELSDDKLLSTIITDEMRIEIADYILAEIKQQISGWIAENLDNIVEDALRSVSTEARDAIKARSVR